MNFGGGANFDEFGCCPVALDVFVDWHQGPAWELRWLRHRSGWLAIAQATLDTPIESFGASLVAGTTDEGELLKSWQTRVLMGLCCSLPKDVFELPPEELEEAMGHQYWDFLGRCDLEHLKLLEQAEEDYRTDTKAVETKAEEKIGWAERAIARLRMRLRLGGLSERVTRTMRAQIVRLEEDIDEAAWESMRAVGDIRLRYQAYDADVLESLALHGELGHSSIIHWTARSVFDRRVESYQTELLFGHQPGDRPSWEQADDLVDDARTATHDARLVHSLSIAEYWEEQDKKVLSAATSKRNRYAWH